MQLDAQDEPEDPMVERLARPAKSRASRVPRCGSPLTEPRIS